MIDPLMMMTRPMRVSLTTVTVNTSGVYQGYSSGVGNASAANGSITNGGVVGAYTVDEISEITSNGNVYFYVQGDASSDTTSTLRIDGSTDLAFGSASTVIYYSTPDQTRFFYTAYGDLWSDGDHTLEIV